MFLTGPRIAGTLVSRSTPLAVWAKRHEYKTPNYHVISNIDRRTCAEAARLLEEAYRAYNVQMEWTKGREESRFKVYLFFSQEAYLTYTRRVMGTSPTNSAGLFSPHLKQLLIWNLPDRKQMLQTVRHEGFHQYLDRILPDPPTWLNEGLAVYYENASYRSGRWETGERRSDLLFRRDDFLPLAQFFRQPSREFYKEGIRSYAQAWAVVYFLRHGPEPYPALFTRLFKDLRTTDRGAEVVERVFSNVEPERMEKDFRAFVKGL